MDDKNSILTIYKDLTDTRVALYQVCQDVNSILRSNEKKKTKFIASIESCLRMLE